MTYELPSFSKILFSERSHDGRYRVDEIEGDHDVCVSAVERFEPLLIAATLAVAHAE